MTVQLDPDFSQVRKLVDRLPIKQKTALARYLADQTLFEEMRQVQDELKNARITAEELAEEVAEVRKIRASRADRQLSTFQENAPVN